MKIKEQVQGEPEMCFTSLIDIVFLLLIFFMCATQFKQVEQKLEAFLPEIDGQKTGKIVTPPPEELSVFVKDDAVARQSPIQQIRAVRQATFFPMSRDARPIADINQLRGILARVHDANPRTRVLIAPYNEESGKDQLVPFFNIVAVLDTCKAVGLDDVAFQAPMVRSE